MGEKTPPKMQAGRGNAIRLRNVAHLHPQVCYRHKIKIDRKAASKKKLDEREHSIQIQFHTARKTTFAPSYAAGV